MLTQTLFRSAWMGLVTTALTRVLETTALGAVGASDAAVIVATEPLWAAGFGVVLCEEVRREKVIHTNTRPEQHKRPRGRRRANPI